MSWNLFDGQQSCDKMEKLAVHLPMAVIGAILHKTPPGPCEEGEGLCKTISFKNRPFQFTPSQINFKP